MSICVDKENRLLALFPSLSLSLSLSLFIYISFFWILNIENFLFFSALFPCLINFFHSKILFEYFSIVILMYVFIG